MSWMHLCDEKPVSKISRFCVLCEQTIPAGERHVRRIGVQDGRTLICRMHAACEAATKGWDDEDWKCRNAVEFRRNLDRSNHGADQPKS